MKVSLHPNIYSKNKNQNTQTFGALKKLRFSPEFNPKKHGMDYLAVHEFINSKAFKYLFEHADVKASFDKIVEKDSQKIRTILHIAAKPKNNQSSKNFAKRLINSVKSHFVKDEWKKHWVEGVEDKTTNEFYPLFKKLSKLTIEDIKSIFSL